MRKQAQFVAALFAAPAALALTACGGGGGVNSTPTPTPAPTPTPTPTPTSNLDIGNLKVSQTFSANSGHEDAQFNLSNATVNSAGADRQALTFAYNAANGSYTVSVGGRSQTFAPSDYLAEESDDRSSVFRRVDGGDRDSLSLWSSVYIPGRGRFLTRAVGMGFWQDDHIAGSTQDTDFNLFLYGNPSAGNVVPRTGTAQFATELFGVASHVGSEPVSITGGGDTYFDFLNGTFQTEVNPSEYLLATGDLLSGGGISFRASGLLASGSGDFSGNFYYKGSQGSVSGAIDGGFYGSNAAEAGATFAAGNGSDYAVVGGFLAVSQGAATRNLTLRQALLGDVFFGPSAYLETRTQKPGGPEGFANYHLDSEQNLIYDATDSSYRLGGVDDADYQATDKVVSDDPKFTKYQRTYLGVPHTLSLYNVSTAAIPLTYSSFGHWSRAVVGDEFNLGEDRWFAYGVDTPENVLTGRKGNATYSGIVYGSGASNDGAQLLNLTGTSQFTLNFSNQSYGGWLRVNGADKSGGAAIDFGQFNLAAGTGFTDNLFRTGFTGSNVTNGSIEMHFYGPTGEELSGAFGISTATGYTLTGATASIRN